MTPETTGIGCTSAASRCGGHLPLSSDAINTFSTSTMAERVTRYATFCSECSSDRSAMSCTSPRPEPKRSLGRRRTLASIVRDGWIGVLRPVIGRYAGLRATGTLLHACTRRRCSSPAFPDHHHRKRYVARHRRSCTPVLSRPRSSVPPMLQVSA